MFLLDVQLALVAMVSLPFVIALTMWFRARSSLAYRATREGVTGVIVQFVETMGGMRAVAAFRREPRNDADLRRPRRQVPPRQRVVDAARRDLRAGHAHHRQLRGGRAAARRRVPRARRRDHRRRARRVPALHEAVLRAGAGAEPVLQRVPVRGRGAREAVGRARGAADGRRARAARADSSSPAARSRSTTSASSTAPAVPCCTTSTSTIAAGSTIALVGRTGAGKSTIARLLSRFYDPTDGARAASTASTCATCPTTTCAAPSSPSRRRLPVRRHGRLEHRPRPARRAARRDRGRGPGHRRAQVHRRAARGLRHRRGQARRPPVVGPDAAGELRRARSWPTRGC